MAFLAHPGEARGAAENSLRITAEALAALPENERVILDTRSSVQFFLGHLPGAASTGDWSDYTRKVNGVSGLLIEDKAWVAGRLRALGIDRNKLLVLYGDPADPWRTDGRFLWMFMRYGFSSVVLLDGGLKSWKEAGGRIERGLADSTASSSLSAADIVLDDSVIATQDWIRPRLGKPDFKIIDNRTPEEFHGATPYGSPRGGHIPGALHIAWQDFFDSAGRLKDSPTISSLLADHGISPGQEIVVYCTGGVRSAMAFFVFKSLGYSVRNYDGSWWDWSHNPALPVENS